MTRVSAANKRSSSKCNSCSCCSSKSKGFLIGIVALVALVILRLPGREPPSTTRPNLSSSYSKNTDVNIISNNIQEEAQQTAVTVREPDSNDNAISNEQIVSNYQKENNQDNYPDNNNNNNNNQDNYQDSNSVTNNQLRIAFGGNSIIFFHDCPGLLADMLKATGYEVTYDACLEGGRSLITLWTQGCSTLYSTTNSRGASGPLTMPRLLMQQWDFIIFNDQTQSPARLSSRAGVIRYLNWTYAEMLYNTGATPIFIQTPAYTHPVDGIGGFDEFTQALRQGYEAYANVLTNRFTTKNQNNNLHQNSNVKHPTSAQVAPIGQAYAHLHDKDPNFWFRLYMEDGIHPTPTGTWLQACILYITMVGKEPPQHDPEFWTSPETGRIRTSYNQPIPTQEDAELLRLLAMLITGMDTGAPLPPLQRT